MSRPQPAAVIVGLADAWERYCNARDGRDRWTGYVDEAETAFASLASEHGLSWIEAVEIVQEAAE